MRRNSATPLLGKPARSSGRSRRLSACPASTMRRRRCAHGKLERPASPHRRRRHRRACGGAGAGAQGHPVAGHRAGAGVQGDRRRHPARAQRVLDVRRARAHRADQRARGVSQQPHHDGFGHRRGSHAHSARRRFPQEISPIPTRSSIAPTCTRCCSKPAANQSDPARRRAEDRQGRRDRGRHRGAHRERQGRIAARP